MNTFEPSEFSPLRWKGDRLELIDQLLLPGEEKWIRCADLASVATAIRTMQVRGAPAIGCAAAYGMVIAARTGHELDAAAHQLAQTRPTAVNLFWALKRMKEVAAENPGDVDRLEKEAIAIHRDDIAMCKAIGRHGEPLIGAGATVLTHCNAGALATGGYGTALGVIRAAHEAGKGIKVLADETRPYLQGARLTTWELLRDGIEVTVLPDSAAAFLLARGEIQCAVVGADRIAANGDVANKIGTYAVALAAQAANVPFYVAAPLSTIDLSTAGGADIPIEERSGDEILQIGDTRIAPAGAKARYPAFDVTPAALVTAIITDQGVAKAPYQSSLAALFDA